MDYARTAAMQLHQTLKQLKEREDAMDVPPGGYPNFQNGGDVGGGSANNNNTGGAAAAESQLSTSYVEQQQPLSPTPLTPQAAPTFAAVAAGQSPNFQLEQQQQQQQQATSQIDGIVPQPFNQQQPQQQTPQLAAAAAVPAAILAAAAATGPDKCHAQWGDDSPRHSGSRDATVAHGGPAAAAAAALRQRQCQCQLTQ